MPSMAAVGQRSCPARAGGAALPPRRKEKAIWVAIARSMSTVAGLRGFDSPVGLAARPRRCPLSASAAAEFALDPRA